MNGVKHIISSDLCSLPYVKADGRCFTCDHKLVVPKKDHVFVRTKGYEKEYSDGRSVIKCPLCGREQLRNRSK